MLAVDRYNRLPNDQRVPAIIRAEKRDQLISHFDGVKNRVRIVTTDRETLNPPTVLNWFQITDAELSSLWKYLLDTSNHLADKGPESVHQVLNAHPNFLKHLEVMHAYVDALSSIPKFQLFLQENTLSVNFFHALVLMHDYGRFIFNGPFPLLYVDGVSDGILKKNFPTFPREYLHSIKWITEQVDAPDSVLMSGGRVADVPLSNRVALMLKALDTLSKLDANGKLLNPETFFAPGGVYEKWIETQIANKRLPFYIQGNKAITAETYHIHDRRLTETGVRVVSALTELPFSQLRDRVAQIITQ